MPIKPESAYPLVSIDPLVQGGAPVVRGTRFPVRAVAFYWRQGEQAGEVREAYPELSDAQLADAVRYYQDHRQQIDVELEQEARAA